MKTSRRRTLEELHHAQRRGRPVRLERSGLHDGEVQGLVLAVTPSWTALEWLDDGLFPDGLVFVRTKHVTRVREDDGDYAQRVLTCLGHRAPDVRLPDGVRTRDVLEVATTRGPMVALHLEHEKSSPMMVGHVVALLEDDLHLHFIDAAGTWDTAEEGLRVFRYREVTRVDVGGRYVDALARFGDPAPERG